VLVTNPPSALLLSKIARVAHQKHGHDDGIAANNAESQRSTIWELSAGSTFHGCHTAYRVPCPISGEAVHVAGRLYRMQATKLPKLRRLRTATWKGFIQRSKDGANKPGSIRSAGPVKRRPSPPYGHSPWLANTGLSMIHSSKRYSTAQQIDEGKM
jgi:hypothetical protein